MKPEFDAYAQSYAELLQDPMRDRFSGASEFFQQRKWALICDFFERQDVDRRRLSWLDVGCGQGDLLQIGRSEVARAVGCDPSRKMMLACTSLEICEQTSPVDLPFPDASFDFITAVCVYHHVEGNSRPTLTKSISRVLRAGGMFCLIEHNPWNPVTQLIVRRCPIDVDAELLSASAGKQLIRAAGLEVVDTAYFLYFPERIFKRIYSIENRLRRLPLGGQYAIFSRRPGVGSANS